MVQRRKNLIFKKENYNAYIYTICQFYNEILNEYILNRTCLNGPKEEKYNIFQNPLAYQA